MTHPFDWKTAVLAKHAQHVVWIHFPIALYISAVVFRLIDRTTDRRRFADAAYYNISAAAIATFPAIISGILAWHFQLESQPIQGILLLHLVFASVSSVMIWLIWGMHFRARRLPAGLPRGCTAIELLAVAAIALTGHLGGFLSGVNGSN
jgi:uncharacterized membrane protein